MKNESLGRKYDESIDTPNEQEKDEAKNQETPSPFDPEWAKALQEGAAEEEHEGSKFLIQNAMGRMVDSYDEHLASVELSHHEPLGYREVIKYKLAPDTDTLDLTWMKDEDIFTFYSSPQHDSVRQMEVNIDNIGSSYLTPGKDMFHDVKLIIHDNNSKMNPVAKVKALRTFMRFNSRAFSDDIQFEGFSPVTTKLLNVSMEHPPAPPKINYM